MPIKASRVISESLRQRFRAARSVFVLTGAGVSAESGVPTFRGGGREAVWKGMPFSVISSAAMVERDLPAVWEWFDFRRDALHKLSPNPAHEVLARWQSRFENFTLVTQNIDGLHKAAGSDDVLELHGNIWRARCVKCEKLVNLRDVRDDVRPPVCNGAAARWPDCAVGEMLHRESLKRHPCGVAVRCVLWSARRALFTRQPQLPEIARAAGAFVAKSIRN